MKEVGEKNNRKSNYLKRFTLLLFFMWTLIVSVSYLWNYNRIEQEALDYAHVYTAIAFEKDILYRFWNASHGGVYVHVTDEMQPNKYLDISNRDIETTNGEMLTIVNPAFMNRQVHEMEKELLQSRSHITSLNPIRPENSPDKWEETALQEFEQGVKEVFAKEEIGGKEYFRMMRPLITENSCLTCHQYQGYKEGDIRGGISVSLPVNEVEKLAGVATRRDLLIHFSLWFICSSLIGFGYIKLRKSDIKRQKAELALRESNVELEGKVIERTKELESSKVEAENASKIKSQFLSNISHELRTPLNIINGNTQLIKIKVSDGQLSKKILNIENSVYQLTKMINNILDFSLADKEVLKIEEEDFVLNDILNRIYATYIDEAKKKDIDLKIEVDKSIPQMLIGDSKKMLNALTLLIDNALKFTNKGSVSVKADLAKTCKDISLIKFSVIDSGIGISKDMINEIFDSFSQLDGSSTKKFSGIGLGLSLCDKIIKILGGKIKIDSELEKGSSFSFEIELKNSNKKIEKDTKIVQLSKKEEQEEEKEVKVCLDKDKVKLLLNDLRGLLEEDDFDATKKIDEIVEISGDFSKLELDKIRKFVEDYDFDEALDLTNKLIDKI